MCSCLEKKVIEKCDPPNSLGMLSIEEPVTILGHTYLRKGIQDLNLNLSPNTVLYYTILPLALVTYLSGS